MQQINIKYYPINEVALLIQTYIFEKKKVVVNIILPSTPLEEELFCKAASIAMNHFKVE